MAQRNSHQGTGWARPVRWGLSLAAAVVLAPHLPVAAQDTRAPAFVEVSTGLTTLHGKTSALGSGSLLLGVTDRIAIGGAAHVVLGARELAGSTSDSDTELSVAYGGLLTQLTLSDTPRYSLWLRFLAGAGNARMDLAVVRTRIAADNFGVLVPELGGTLHLKGPFHAGVALGYRSVFGVEDLPGLTSQDLPGPTGRVLLSVIIF